MIRLSWGSLRDIDLEIPTARSPVNELWIERGEWAGEVGEVKWVEKSVG